jgi:very-short-patch-repair endonuclease
VVHRVVITPLSKVMALADRRHGIVTRRQLHALDLSDTAIRGWIRRGVLHRVHRGVYSVGPGALAVEGRMLAAVLACGPGAALSHRSAAALWGLRQTDQRRIDVTAVVDAGRRDRAITFHRTRTLDADRTTHRGVPITTVARTLVDLAGVVPVAAVERALSQAEVLSLYDHTALDEVLERSNGRRGARALRAALGVPIVFTRSELENRMLALCRRHRLPTPQVNAIVCGQEVDFYWPAARLIVETDGHKYHRTQRAFEDDRRRDADLTVAGHRVVRITYRRLVNESDAVAGTIRALLEGVGIYGSLSDP